MNFKDAIDASAEKRRSKIVLALDFGGPYQTRLKRAEDVLRATANGVAAVKLNHHLVLPLGLQGVKPVIDMCRNIALPIIADLKLNDIEATNLNVVDSLLDFGVTAVIANPFVGKEEGLGKVVEQMHSRDGGVILLVYMSHKGAEEGYGLKVEGGRPVYELFAERARDWGADGVVVSGKSPDIIGSVRRIVGRKCMIFSPGVGRQGGSYGVAEESGSDYVIVGRALTEAADPAAALKQLVG